SAQRDARVGGQTRSIPIRVRDRVTLEEYRRTRLRRAARRDRGLHAGRTAHGDTSTGGRGEKLAPRVRLVHESATYGDSRVASTQRVSSHTSTIRTAGASAAGRSTAAVPSDRITPSAQACTALCQPIRRCRSAVVIPTEG